MPDPRDRPLASEPPLRANKAQLDARILDPYAAPVVEDLSGRPTIYVGDRLIVAKGDRRKQQVDILKEVAESLGWVAKEDREKARFKNLSIGVVTVSITATKDSIDRAPDAWYLLQKARLHVGAKHKEKLSGVGLDHVVDARPMLPNPFDLPHTPDPQAWLEPYPFDMPHPFDKPPPFDMPHPESSGGVSTGLASYGAPGSGGRTPVAYVGPKPGRTPQEDIAGRRPVVAILDTGCYPHFWFDGVVTTKVKLDQHPIGLTSSSTDPELQGDVSGPFDGSIDRIAGHGTFISGLVHQACPDAEILSWRGIPATEPMIESKWLNTLAQIAELARRHRHNEDGGYPIDVLSLSMGYYHENEADELVDAILRNILDELSRNGVVVVVSAGNDATGRPSYPAAFAPWDDDKGPVKPRKDVVPVVSVGALNPNRTDALFTNAGPWVRCYAPGASVVSTMPPFVGGLQPLARTIVGGRIRESIDPDDYRGGVGRRHRGGFGLWSGTSFAAPTVAGAIAAVLSQELAKPGMEERSTDSARSAITRGWNAVEALTTMKRPRH